jgi:DNA (cytosine-5)-methyltransferase 1
MAPIKDHHWPTAAWNVGEGRMRVFASEWPVRRRYKSLHQLLNTRKAKKLSFKATRGFLLRADRAQLQFPPGFIAALEAHRDEMASAIEAGVSRVVRRQGRRSKAKRS